VVLPSLPRSHGFHPLENYREPSMHLSSGVYVVYYKLLGGTTFQMKRSADVLTSHHSHTSSVLHHTFWLIHGPHGRALRSSVTHLPRDWNCRLGRPRQTWLHTVEPDVIPLNIGLATTYHWAQNWQAWRLLVETATSTGQATWWWWWWWWWRWRMGYHCSSDVGVAGKTWVWE